MDSPVQTEQPDPFDGIPCAECGQMALRLVWKLEAKPVGSYSLAGAQMKFSANEHPWCVCDSCGAECKGKRE